MEKSPTPISQSSTHQELKEAVYRLLKYAVSDADINVDKMDSTLINRVVPLLKKEGEFSLEEEEVLWRSYNALSILVAPANNESLWFKEEMEEEDRNRTKQDESGFFYSIYAWFKNAFAKDNHYPISTSYQRHSSSLLSCAVIFGIIFLFLQSYTTTLSDALKQVDQYRTQLTLVETQIATAKAAKTEGKLDLCVAPFFELISQREKLLLKIDGHYHVTRKLSVFFPNWLALMNWGAAFSNDTETFYSSKLTICLEKRFQVDTFSQHGYEISYDDQKAEAERAIFFEGAKSVLQLCNYLFLPFVMGTLGATAYVIRKLLDSFTEASLTFGPNRKGYVRIGLGALLGLISGVIITPGIKEIQEMSYSPLLWAFLMGYSVEFAFGVFDWLIKRGRDALLTNKASISQVNPAPQNPSPSSNPNNSIPSVETKTPK